MMVSALSKIAGSAESPSTAVLAACTLEASAPKAGNVTPENSFANLRYDDFLTAAKIAADAFANQDSRVCQRTLTAATETAAKLRTNVNLGILLLLTPIISADEVDSPKTLLGWQSSVSQALARISESDSADLLRAIQVSSAGGLGEVDQMDVNRLGETDDFDIMSAMRLAASRDRIAKQYAEDFADFFNSVLPVVLDSLKKVPDPLLGIADAHLRLLALDVDSLIVRKCGIQVAKEIQRRAAKVDRNDADSQASFDTYLRSQSNRLNPGTTADLIAAALYVIVRTNLF
jgi:triphosphoribosyl-dephospho-CoA synthase